MRRAVTMMFILILTPLVMARDLPLDEDGKSPFVGVAKKVMPSVVNISAEKVIQFKIPEYQDPFYEFWKRFYPDFPREQKEKSLGSGLIITEDGYLLTNNHVVEGAENIVVKSKERTYRDVEVVGRDPLTDLALLKLDEKDLPYSELGNSDEIEVGDWVIAIGNPFGLERTVTVGVVSAKHRTGINLPGGGSFQDFIQTDAAINPGNSGGPLVNIMGEVVAINTAIQTSGFPGNIGIGFAIPSNIAKDIIRDLMTKGEVERGYLGIYYQEVTRDMAEGLGIETTEGVIVSQVVKDSPADEAGLKEGDIILEFDGDEVSFSQFPFMVGRTPIGAEVTIRVYREGKEFELDVTIAQRPPEKDIAEPERIEEAWLGLEVVSITSKEARDLGVEEDEGVLVMNVQAEGAGYGYMQVGDVIKKINNAYIRNLEDYNAIKENLKDSDSPIVILIKRGDISRFITITP